MALRPLIATVLFAAYWLAIVWGFFDPDRGEWPLPTRELFYGLVVFLPCAVVGVIHGRWWAPTVTLVFLVAVVLPERCVTTQDFDVITTRCSGLDEPGELVELLVLTVPSVLAGVVAVKLAGRARAALSPSAG